jgi:hypothetical protein
MREMREGNDLSQRRPTAWLSRMRGRARRTSTASHEPIVTCRNSDDHSLRLHANQTASVLFRRARVLDVHSSVQLTECQQNASLQPVVVPGHAFLQRHRLFCGVVRHPAEEIGLLLFRQVGFRQDFFGAHRVLSIRTRSRARTPTVTETS